MEQLIADLLTNYGWIGFIIAVFLFLLTNTSSTTFFSSLIEHFSKSKDVSPIKPNYKFTLLTLTRPSDKHRRLKAIIPNALLLVFFFFVYYISISKNLGETIKLLSYIGMVFPVFFLCDILIIKKTTTSLTIEGNPDDLFRTYQMMLFDMSMIILSFDSLNREVIAKLNGTELSIKINPQEGGTNTVAFTFQRDFFGIVFYTKEYQRNKQKLIYDTCYPKISNND